MTCSIGFAQTARVSGRVVTTEGKPVSKAVVRIQGGGGGRGGPPPKSYVEVTAGDGRFSVEDIAPGSYQTSAQLNGYREQIYSPSAPASRRPGAFTIAAGDSVRDIEITLVPLGIVSGLVLDSDGDPVPRIQVQLMRYTFNQGRVQLTNSSGVSTDDRGLFRFGNLQHGRYYLRANASNPISGNSPNEIRGASAQQANLTTFYPSSPDVRSATRIEVASTPIENLQVRMLRGRTYTIRGVIDGVSGNQRPSVTMTAKGSNGSNGVRMDGNKFEAVGVPPGFYTFAAQFNEGQVMHVAYADVSVGAGDVDNVVMRFQEPLTVAGRIRSDDGSDWKTFSPAPVAVVKPLPDGTNPPIPATPPNRPAFSLTPVSEMPIFTNPNIAAKEDGSFTIKNITPGPYAISLSNNAAGAYIKSIRLGGRDVTNQTLDFTSGGELDLVVSKKLGSLKIDWPSRLSERKDTDPAVQAYLWPATPDWSSLNGRVSVVALQQQNSRPTQVAPGEYYIAVFDEVPDNDVARIPDFLARFNAAAARVTVPEGTPVSIEPGVISRETSRRAFDEFP